MERIANRAWPKVSWMTWALAAFATVVTLTCTVNSLAWVHRPFPGFFLWENLFVPSVGDTDWTGYTAEIPFPAQLLSVNGIPVHSAAEVYTTAAEAPLGKDFLYAFRQPGEAAPVERHVATMRFERHDYALTLGTYISIGVLLTLLGFLVYILRPDSAAARGMLSSAATWGLYFVTAADIFGPAWFRPLCLILQALSPVTMLHLALTFPVERPFLQRRPYLLRGLYGGAALIGIFDNFLFERSFEGTLRINQLHGLASTVGGLVLISMLVQSFVWPASPGVRQRMKIAALGAVAAFLLPIAGISLFSLLGVTFPLNFLALPLAAFPLAIGYAIVKHDLFEVDAFIRRSVSWAILSGIVAVIYLGGVGTLELIFTGRGSRVAQLMFLLLIVAVFNPLRNRVQAVVDFLFARDRYDYQATVDAASQALASLLDVDTIVHRILHAITDTMHIDLGAVWLREDGGYHLQDRAGSRVAAAIPSNIAAANPMVAYLQDRRRRLLTPDPIDAQSRDASSELGALGLSLVVPMRFENEIIGFVGLGEKESGHFYSREDVGLLRTLANQGAVAVENARSYRALERAGEELRAAQSRLIEAERLAAIGELSAAVAHGIRNPLAGIKTAAQMARLDLDEDSPMRESIDDIIGEADKLEQRIQTLLDFSKPFEPRVAGCRVEAIVGSAVDSLQAQIARQGIELRVDIAKDLPSVMLDLAQIEQVLLALMSNAAEAMIGAGGKWPEGHTTRSSPGEVPWISVTAKLSARPNYVHIDVEDNGPGIPPEILPRVFKLFFTTKSSGTGFGLAVAKKIVERHGGSIELSSQVGKGTHFAIELPTNLAGPVEH